VDFSPELRKASCALLVFSQPHKRVAKGVEQVGVVVCEKCLARFKGWLILKWVIDETKSFRVPLFIQFAPFAWAIFGAVFAVAIAATQPPVVGVNVRITAGEARLVIEVFNRTFIQFNHLEVPP
jgi:hypothetical protein